MLNSIKDNSKAITNDYLPKGALDNVHACIEGLYNSHEHRDFHQIAA
jgi:hypothetical protein